MSTKTHDEMIETAVWWARSLGYDVVECHLGTETGADAVFQNMFGEKVILEVVTGSSFKGLFRKPRIKKALEIEGEKEKHWPETLGLIVVGDRISLVRDHGIEAGLPVKLFDSREVKRIFPVRLVDFKQVIPVLLVSLLGIRGSSKARVW